MDKLVMKVSNWINMQKVVWGLVWTRVRFPPDPPIDIVDEYARFEFVDGSLSLVINFIKYEESR